MISLKIDEPKEFMNLLLKKDALDYWEGRQIDIHTYTHFKIDCKLNKDFFDTDELEKMNEQYYATWHQLKSSVIALIKGTKQPSNMKIVLSFPIERIKDVDTSMVDGLFINIHLDKGSLQVTTGVSMKTFTMDKTMENHWDSLIRGFFKKNNILAQ